MNFRYWIYNILCMQIANSYKIVNQRIVDNYNRERVFHGVNVIVKLFPCHPLTNEFNYNHSFNDYDINLIKLYGLNIIRLGVMWSCVEPQQGVYNYSYLNIMQQFVKKLDENDIFVLIEFHQDALSEYFCGEGIPDWANSNSDFPIPLGLPYNISGKPSKEQCLSKDWWHYLFSFAAEKKYKELYSNTVLRQSFLNYWNITAYTFNRSKNVIGYEFINEPFVPVDGLIPKESVKKYLEPFYNVGFEMMNTRGYLNDKLFLFEPVTWADFGSGFSNPPGGNNNKSVLSYHCYFPPEISVEQLFKARVKDQETLKVAAFLTELGSNRMLDVFEYTDKLFHSWTAWSYKKYSGITGDGSMFFNKNGTNASTRVLFNRSYPRAICGHGIYFNFNVTNNSFILTYQNDQNCGKSTEIYTNCNMNITVYPFNNFTIENNVVYVPPHNNSNIVTIRGVAIPLNP